MWSPKNSKTVSLYLVVIKHAIMSNKVRVLSTSTYALLSVKKLICLLILSGFRHYYMPFHSD